MMAPESPEPLKSLPDCEAVLLDDEKGGDGVMEGDVGWLFPFLTFQTVNLVFSLAGLAFIADLQGASFSLDAWEVVACQLQLANKHSLTRRKFSLLASSHGEGLNKLN